MIRKYASLVFSIFVLTGLFQCTNQKTAKITPPDWMKKQIDHDLDPFKEKKISLKKMKSYFAPKLIPHRIVEIQIHKNKIKKIIDPDTKNNWICHRIDIIYTALRELAKTYPLPDVSIYIHLWDSFEQDSDYPIFVFAKNRKFTNQILIPDFSALAAEYQVVPNIDLESIELPWEEKCSKLVWRGSTSQGVHITSENYRSISRVTLCELSHQLPHLIDAGFTLLYQGAENVPQIKNFYKERVCYEQLVRNKYQLWIDGNSASYSDSGWRFFSNCVVIKPESENIQWYYQALEPNKHYIPVKENLENLAETIEFLQNNDLYAKEIAKNGRDFALKNITRSHCLLYLYHLLWEYSRLPFNIDE